MDEPGWTEQQSFILIQNVPLKFKVCQMLHLHERRMEKKQMGIIVCAYQTLQTFTLKALCGIQIRSAYSKEAVLFPVNHRKPNQRK